MSFVLRFTPLFIAALPHTAQAEENTPAGLIDGASLELNLRNAYYHVNSLEAGERDKREWGQGVFARFESGYTPGVIGVGVDAHAMLGLRLDGGDGHAGTDLLPHHQKHEDELGAGPHAFSSAGAALKFKAFDTEFKAGDLLLSNPVIEGGDIGLLPQTFRGVALTNTSIEGLLLEGGQVSFTKPYNQSGQRRIDTEYGQFEDGEKSRHLKWAGASWNGNEPLTGNLYAAQLKDIWNQYYADLDYQHALNDLVSLNPGVHIYRTQDSGQALLGRIANTTYSLHFTVAAGHHSVTTAYQRVNGNTPFDFISQGDSIYLDNSRMYSDFNGPNERSWMLQYAYDFAGLGIPGLSSSISYSRGKLDLTKINPASPGYGHWYSAEGKNARHWERDLDVQYVFQQGSLKGLSIMLSYASHRGSRGYSAVDSDADELRMIVNYPVNIF